MKLQQIPEKFGVPPCKAASHPTTVRRARSTARTRIDRHRPTGPPTRATSRRAPSSSRTRSRGRWRVRSTVSRPAKRDILIAGETGAGKELAARRYPCLSQRRDQPFVAVNCAALSEARRKRAVRPRAPRLHRRARRRRRLVRDRRQGTFFLTKSANSRSICRASSCASCKTGGGARRLAARHSIDVV